MAEDWNLALAHFRENFFNDPRIWATVGLTLIVIVVIWGFAIWADNKVKGRKVIDLDAPVECGDITAEALARHNGTDPFLPIYFAVRGKVYDVTKSRSFYGPGGSYEVFAGKEVARALAVMSTDPKDCTGDLSGVSEEQLKVLGEWEKKFETKYGVVGQVVSPKELSLEELAAYDGKTEGKPIYLAIKGTIFDVTKGRDFYGPDGMYPFAGKECARALAKFSTDVADCTDQLEGLDFMELDQLRDWEARFAAKYPIVGLVVDRRKKN